MKSQSRDNNKGRPPRVQEDRDEYRQRGPQEQPDNYPPPPPPRGYPRQDHEGEPVRGRSRQENQTDGNRRIDRDFGQRVPQGEGERRWEGGRDRREVQHVDDRQRSDIQERE